MTEKTDLRVLKTRLAIKNAFITLIQKKEYENITVQDITSEAMINRNTFYLHYMDKADLMEKLCIEHLERFNICYKIDINNLGVYNKHEFEINLRKIFSILKDDIIFYKAMLSQNGQPHFYTQLKRAFYQLFITDFDNTNTNLNTKISIEYFLSGLVGVICLWIMDYDNMDIEEVIRTVLNLNN